MRTIPVLLDARPRYLDTPGTAESLLLLPSGESTLAAEICEHLARVTAQPAMVLPAFEPDERYLRRLRAACPSIGDVTTAAMFRDPLALFDPSDALLLVSPECYQVDGLDVHSLVEARLHDARMVRHLLGFEATSFGTKELVHSGADGRVRRIQRYFDPVTWPFAAGVIASLVPVACLLATWELPLDSLDELRRALTARGIPNQDVPFRGELLDLNEECGALALCERRLVSAAQRAAERVTPARADLELRADRAIVHPNARLVGPVRLHPSAVVEEDALIIGPTVVGAGATVRRGAVVAQCLVMPDAVVTAESTVRHRVLAAAPSEATPRERLGRERRHTPILGHLPVQAQRKRWAWTTLKLAIDVPLACLALLLLGPVLLVISALVKLTSAGPIFYGDPREGIDGKPFRCWKFRSMRVNANDMQRQLAAKQQMDGPQFKMDNDPRVTPIGAWLRRLNVDELPQLFNVACGQMSFVGPRPSPFRENQICVPWRKGRLSVRPGITGLWQVCRHDRANGDFHQWIHYDLLYVKHSSFGVDARILLATLFTLGGKRPVRLSAIVGRAAEQATREGLARERRMTPVSVAARAFSGAVGDRLELR